MNLGTVGIVVLPILLISSFVGIAEGRFCGQLALQI